MRAVKTCSIGAAAGNRTGWSARLRWGTVQGPRLRDRIPALSEELDRVDRGPVIDHFEVHMRPRRESARSDRGDGLAHLHWLSDVHEGFETMGVQRDDIA